MISRLLKSVIQTKMYRGKAILVMGPRQVGKTTLVKMLVKECSGKTLFLNCDDPAVRSMLDHPTLGALSRMVGTAKLLVIDEAQRVMDIGITLKLIIDNLPDAQCLVTGSSAFELSNKINEPLTGRKFEYHMYPISVEELIQHTTEFEEKRLLETRLIFGMYPDVINNPGDERDVLMNLTTSYLYKDLFAFQDIRKPQILSRFLEAVALQLGSEVSISELANVVGVDVKTLEKYLDLLEKSFIIFRLRSFSRNERNEIKKSRKIYFYDNGIRNAVISNFKPLSLRTDTGALWENFLVSERMKRNTYHSLYPHTWFWRTKQQQEIDYLEDVDGELSAFEFKWKENKKTSFPVTFTKAYPEAKLTVIHPGNYGGFVCK